jgi:RNA polymerase sigma-70 factor (ECF subfamily)
LSRWLRALTELATREQGRYVDLDRDLSARDGLLRLQPALDKLSEAKRVVLLMAEFEQLSSQEIADALEIPVGTVWTRLHHARNDLRRLLECEVAR